MISNNIIISWPYLPLQGNNVLPHRQYSSFLSTILQFISFHRYDSPEAKKSKLLRFSRQVCVLGLKILPLLSGTVWKPKNLRCSDSVAKSVTSILTYFETFIFPWAELEFLFKCVYSEFALINRWRLLCQQLWCLILLLCCIFNHSLFKTVY